MQCTATECDGTELCGQPVFVLNRSLSIDSKVEDIIGPMKGGLSVGRRPKILANVRCRLGNETVSVGLKWSVKCRITNSECRCGATLILG